MSDRIDDLKSLWKRAGESVKDNAAETHVLIKMAQKRKAGATRMHALNILVLVITLAGISAFFIYVAKFQQLISHVGVTLMVGGLLVRIVIEIFSVYLATRIDMSENALHTNNRFLHFYRFRKAVHGPVTITILVLYTVGFYMLTPEFSEYFSLPMMILIDASYIVAAVIFGWNILMAVRKEMRYLNEIKRIQEDIKAV